MKIDEITYKQFEQEHRKWWLETSYGGTYTPAIDNNILYALIKRYNCSRLLEIGTAFGDTTANLTEWTSPDAVIYSIGSIADLHIPHQHGQVNENPVRGSFAIYANRFSKVEKVFFITGNSTTFNFERLGPLDFAFIDGGHDFATASSDSTNVYNSLVPGGVMAWHDFYGFAVRECIQSLPYEEKVIAVKGTSVAYTVKGGLPVVKNKNTFLKRLKCKWKGHQWTKPYREEEGWAKHCERCGLDKKLKPYL